MQQWLLAVCQEFGITPIQKHWIVNIDCIVTEGKQNNCTVKYNLYTNTKAEIPNVKLLIQHFRL